MKVTHYRLKDTGQTTDLSRLYPGEGVVSVFEVEVQKSKNKWEAVKGKDGILYGCGVRQTIENIRYTLHRKSQPVHAYQIDEIDPSPLIAVPEGYGIKYLYEGRTESWSLPDYYLPYTCMKIEEHREDHFMNKEFYQEDGSIKVFHHYKEALKFLRQVAGEQLYPYDVCTVTF